VCVNRLRTGAENRPSVIQACRRYLVKPPSRRKNFLLLRINEEILNRGFMQVYRLRKICFLNLVTGKGTHEIDARKVAITPGARPAEK